MSQSDPLLDVAELAVQEMGRRLKEDPAKIPDGALSKVIADTLRIADKREKAEDTEEDKPFDLMEAVDTMPRERAIELVKEEMARLGEELVRYKEVLDKLEGEESA